MKLRRIKEILHVCEKTIDNYANRIGASDEIVEYIENLQSQLKEKEEVITKLKQWLDQEYEDCNKIVTPAIGCAMGQIRRVKTKIQELEILSKGENDEILK